MHCAHALGKALVSCRSVLDARRGWFLVPRSAHLCASAESASLPWASSWRPKTEFFLHRAFLLDARSGTVFNATARRLHQHRWRAWACRRSARSKCNWVQEPGRGGHESALRGRRFADRLLWRTPAPCQAGHACGKRRRLAARRAVLVRHAYAEAACWHQLMRAPNSQWGSHEPNAQAWAGHVLRDRELLRVATAAA